MNKKIKLLLNILIAVAAVAFFVCFVVMIGSFSYRKEQNAKIPEGEAMDMRVFDYRLKHKAYGEILNSYFTDLYSSMEPPEAIAMTYYVSDYANTAFMRRVYEEKKDAERERACREKLARIRTTLGDYAYTADELDEILK